MVLLVFPMTLLLLCHRHQIAKRGDAFGTDGNALGTGIVVELQGKPSLVVGLYIGFLVEGTAVSAVLGSSIFRVIAMIVVAHPTIAFKVGVTSAVAYIVG